MKYKNEDAYYEEITIWLKKFLEAKYQNHSIYTKDIHSQELTDFIERAGLKRYFPEYSTYKIQVDIIGVIKNEKADTCSLVFVEVKKGRINLSNLSQLLGYCKVAKPKHAFLISPEFLSRNLKNILIDFKRRDVLEFREQEYIYICKWDTSKQNIDFNNTIPTL